MTSTSTRAHAEQVGHSLHHHGWTPRRLANALAGIARQFAETSQR